MKQVSWVDEGDDRFKSELNPPTDQDDKGSDPEEYCRQDADKPEKGSKTIKKLKLIRQKTVQYVQDKETEWKTNISKEIINFLSDLKCSLSAILCRQVGMKQM